MHLSWSPLVRALTGHGGCHHRMHPRELPSVIQTIEPGPQLILLAALLREEDPLTHIFSAQQRFPMADGWVLTVEERGLHFLAGQFRRELMLSNLSPLTPKLLETLLMLDQWVRWEGIRLGECYGLALLLLLYLIHRLGGTGPL